MRISMILLLSLISVLLSGQHRHASYSRSIDSAAAAMYAEGNVWKLLEYSQQFNTDTLSARFLFSLGMSYAAVSEYQKAHEFLNRAVALDSASVHYRFQFARVLSGAGLHNEAVLQLETCLRLDSAFVPARFQLGLTIAAMKNQPEREIELFSSLARNNPNDFLSLYYISDACKRMGLQDSAMVYLRRSIDINPRYTPALIAAANYLHGQKRYADALRLYLAADSLRSGNKDLIFQIGECYRKLGNIESAKRYFSSAIALDSMNSLYHAQLAYAHYSAGEFDSSVAAYRMAIAYDGENAQYYLNLALVFQQLNKSEETIRSYKDAVRVMHPETIALVFYDLGSFCYSKGLWRESADAFLRTSEIDPGHGSAQYYYASSLMQLSEHQGALKAFTAYLKRSANDSTQKSLRYSAEKLVEYLKNLKKR